MCKYIFYIYIIIYIYIYMSPHIYIYISHSTQIYSRGGSPLTHLFVSFHLCPGTVTKRSQVQVPTAMETSRKARKTKATKATGPQINLESVGHWGSKTHWKSRVFFLGIVISKWGIYTYKYIYIYFCSYINMYN